MKVQIARFFGGFSALVLLFGCIGTMAEAQSSSPISVGGKVVVTADVLKVRVRPTTNADVVARKASGVVGKVVDGPVTAGGYVWWVVRWEDNNAVGWSADDFMQSLGTPTPTPTPAPTVTLTAYPTAIMSGQSSVLGWSSSNATSCSGNGFSASGTTGSVSVLPTQTTTYSITCTGTGGSASANTTITVQTSQPTPTPTPVTNWWQPGPVALAWQWEIDHPLSLSSAKDMGTGVTAYNGTTPPATDPVVYDIDGFDNPASTVAALHAMGKKVVCYIEVGAAENYRPDYAQFPAAGLGKTMPGYSSERYVDIRNPQVVSVIKNRIKMCADKGFDAIEPDIDESYTSDTGFPLTKSDEEAFMTTLANYAHSLGVAMWGKNPDDTGDSYAADMVNTFDAILTEQCNQYGTCGLLNAYTGKKPVFNAEYSASTSSFCPADNARTGWSGVKFPLALSGARTPCR